MQEKTLLTQETRTSNIHSSEFGSVSYDIFGSPYQKSVSFLATDSLDFGYLGKPTIVRLVIIAHGQQGTGNAYSVVDLPLKITIDNEIPVIDLVILARSLPKSQIRLLSF